MKKSLGLKSSSAIASGTARALTVHAAERYFNGDVAIRLLDVGCGAGDFMRSLPSRFECEGVDYNGISGQRVDLSYQPLPFADCTFDAVTAWQVFEHLENPFFAGREIQRVLKTGGILLLSVPNIKRLRTRFGFLFNAGILRWSKKNDHLFIPLEAVLKKTIFRGLQIVAHEYRDGGTLSGVFSEWFAKNEYYALQK